MYSGHVNFFRITSHKHKIYLWHKRFPIGSNEEHEILASAPCCVKEFQFIVTDVAGNVKRIRASQKDCKLARIARIATPICIALVVLIALICLAVFLQRRKKKYGTYGLRTRKPEQAPVRRLSYSGDGASRSSRRNITSGINEDTSAPILRTDNSSHRYQNAM